MPRFKLHAAYQPAGDQPEAINKLASGINQGKREQILLGVTGSGKTFTMANVIEQVQKPTLVIAHNKTLAAQLCAEFREFFPENAVEYFVSYYDYYQPEAYIPSTDTYIEKESDINEEIDRLRHKATSSLLSRKDVIVVASVSCIYGLGTPEEYLKSMLNLQVGNPLDREEFLKQLIRIRYERNDLALERGKFRARGDVIEIFPVYEQRIYRIVLYGDKIESLSQIQPATMQKIADLEDIVIFPATHHLLMDSGVEIALGKIEAELEEQIKLFTQEKKFIEEQRIRQRTKFDLDMIRNVGYCNGIENYSRHLAGRSEGDPPAVLLDYFRDNHLVMIDESHVMIPQVRGMYNGDRSRKRVLIDNGFRLPSAYDNRPLTFDEFNSRLKQVIYVSATPGDYEFERCKVEKKINSNGRYASENMAEQVIRPTGLVDPEVVVRPSKYQIDDLINEIRKRIEQNQRTLVTTLTIKMAEELSGYLKNTGLKVCYIHSKILTLERIDILHDLRAGVYDVLVGINLLREGIDLPEVSLVAILDADKSGFLRTERSLVQTIGRAARNVNGLVILYADEITPAMNNAIYETTRRRKIQLAYNEAHGITPQTIIKELKSISKTSKSQLKKVLRKGAVNPADLPAYLQELELEMLRAADNLEFELAAVIRDQIETLQTE